MTIGGISLLECFKSSHPLYAATAETARDAEKYKPKASSDHTAEQDLPLTFLSQNQMRWTTLAVAFLNSPQAQNNDTMTKEAIAAEEDAKAAVAIEQGVVRVATLCLMHPIGIAINVKYNVPITQAMDIKKDRCRLDLSFNINQRDKEKKKFIMIIEFKRTGLIKAREFVNATPTSEAPKKKLLKMVEKYGRETATEYDTDAYWFTKQAVANPQGYKCKFVGLCDSESLILLYFEDRLDKVRMTVGDRDKFRLALLGFFIEACDAHGFQ